MARVFDHIDFRVRDIAAAKSFYDGMLRLFGLRGKLQEDGSVVYLRIAVGKIEEAFALLEDRAHRPSAPRVAFFAASTEEVDRFAARVLELGARNVQGADWCPEIGPNYYACFFEDADGNRFEIVCR